MNGWKAVSYTLAAAFLSLLTAFVLLAPDSPAGNGRGCLSPTDHCGPSWHMVDDTARWQHWLYVIHTRLPGEDPYHCLVQESSGRVACDDGRTT